MGVTLRRLAEADVPAIVAFHAAVEAVDDTGEHLGADDVLDDLRFPRTELTGAYDDAGELAGVVMVSPRAEMVVLSGWTRPDRRGAGIGTRLATLMMDRAHELRAQADGPLRCAAGARSDDSARGAVLEAAGMTADRRSLTMRVPLPAAWTAPLPDGYATRAFTEADDPHLHETHTTVFRDHPNSVALSAEEWAADRGTGYRPELTFLVSHVDAPLEIAAYAMADTYAADDAATGERAVWLSRFGTRREHRGRGVGGALLAHALAAYAAAGLDVCMLVVDSENPTGARRLYERAGFTAHRHFTYFTRTLP